MIVLGYHGEIDAILPRSRGRGAAALVIDGRVVAACEDSLFAGKEGAHASTPDSAIPFVLKHAGLHSLADVDLVAYAGACEPITARDLIARAGSGLGPGTRAALGLAATAWRHADAIGGGGLARSRRALAMRTGAELQDERFVAVAPYIAQLAAAFYGSGLDRALVVALGARRDTTSFAAAIGRGTRLEVIERVLVPDSLMHLRDAVARHLGLGPSCEQTLSMLAARGDAAVHRRFFRSLVQVRRDGIARVDASFVLDSIARAALGTSSPRALVRALGPARTLGAPLEEGHAHIAAALEETLEVAMLASLQVLRERSGERDLCLTGTLALDADSNGRIARSGLFDRVCVPAAPHGPGAAIGAALYTVHHAHGHARRPPGTPFLGPEADDTMLDRAIAVFASEVRATRPNDLARHIASGLAQGEIIGWVEGRAPYAATMHGARSLLADPRRPESARLARSAAGVDANAPLIALIPIERAGEWVDLDGVGAPTHGLFALPLRAERRHALPALALPDGRVRVQLVSSTETPRLHALLVAFGDRTGVPVLLEADLRAGGARVPHGPDATIEALLASSIDRLVLNDRVLERRADPVGISRATESYARL